MREVLLSFYQRCIQIMQFFKLTNEVANEVQNNSFHSYPTQPQLSVTSQPKTILIWTHSGGVSIEACALCNIVHFISYERLLLIQEGLLDHLEVLVGICMPYTFPLSSVIYGQKCMNMNDNFSPQSCVSLGYGKRIEI